MATVVPIEKVVILNEYLRTDRYLKKMKDVLEKQGQIEPLQVQSMKVFKDGLFQFCYVPFEEDVYAEDIILAARELKWPTLLIVEMDKYEA